MPEGVWVCEEARRGAGVSGAGAGLKGKRCLGKGSRSSGRVCGWPQVEGRVSLGVHMWALGAALLIGGRRAGLGLSPPSPLGGHPVRPARGRQMRVRSSFAGLDETSGGQPGTLRGGEVQSERSLRQPQPETEGDPETHRGRGRAPDGDGETADSGRDGAGRAVGEPVSE